MSRAPDPDVLRRLRRHSDAPEESALQALRVVSGLARLALLAATPELLHDDDALDLDDPAYRDRVRAARRLVAQARRLDRAIDRYLAVLDDEQERQRRIGLVVDRWPF